MLWNTRLHAWWSLLWAQTLEWIGARRPFKTPAWNFITGILQVISPGSHHHPNDCAPFTFVGLTQRAAFPPRAVSSTSQILQWWQICWKKRGVIFLEIEFVPLEIRVPAACMVPWLEQNFHLERLCRTQWRDPNVSPKPRFRWVLGSFYPA